MVIATLAAAITASGMTIPTTEVTVQQGAATDAGQLATGASRSRFSDRSMATAFLVAATDVRRYARIIIPVGVVAEGGHNPRRCWRPAQLRARIAREGPGRSRRTPEAYQMLRIRDQELLHYRGTDVGADPGS